MQPGAYLFFPYDRDKLYYAMVSPGGRTSRQSYQLKVRFFDMRGRERTNYGHPHNLHIPVVVAAEFGSFMRLGIVDWACGNDPASMESTSRRDQLQRLSVGRREPIRLGYQRNRDGSVCVWRIDQHRNPVLRDGKEPEGRKPAKQHRHEFPNSAGSARGHRPERPGTIGHEPGP